MKNLLLKNTATNYLTMIVRSLQGILVTRWMIAYLGTDNYGLWALLWAFFAYALLLDFGFGLTAMKYTSSGLYRQDIRKYNSIISAVFSFHALGGLLIASGGLLDFASGRIPRAPKWMLTLKIEWIYRLYNEPIRLFRRYIIGNPLFLWRVFRRGAQSLYQGDRKP